MEQLDQYYRLEPHLKLQPGPKIGYIYSTYPLFVTRTSSQVIEILRECDGLRPVSQLARRLKLKPSSLLKVLAALQARGFVRLEATGPLSQAELPTVSIIVPVYNRPDELRKCLTALVSLDYPAEKREIIVVDDASTDTTGQVAQEYACRVVRNSPQLGPAASRNQGAALATSELIACVDSDCIVQPDWLRRLAGLFSDPEVAAAGGATRAAATATLLQRYEDVASSLFMGQHPAEVRLHYQLSYLPTCNLVLRRTAFNEMNGFDPALRFGEDVDLCWRLLKGGWRIRYYPAARLRHAYRSQWRGFLKTRLDYASSEAFLVARHPDKRRTLYLPGGILVQMLKFMLHGSWFKVGNTEVNEQSQVVDRVFLLGSLLARVYRRWRDLRSYGLPISFGAVLVSELRSQAAAGYHLGLHLGKYYSPVLLAGLLPRSSRLIAALLLLGPPLTNYFRLKPQINLLSFIGLSLLENLAYQIGLIKGCLQQRNFTALFPKIRLSH